MTQSTNPNNLIKNLVREYVGRRSVYEDFAASVRRLLVLFLRASGVNTYSITYRTKEVYSLKQKIKRKIIDGRDYQGLDDIVDIAGVRIIVYFKNDIEKIERIIQEEFRLHKKYNVDQMNVGEQGRYESGYTSTHRVVSLNKKRLKLKEYRAFVDLKCEVQIRTLLQHTWAQVEHGIGYKPEVSESGETRTEIKKLFREAAMLLERADDTFVEIHNVHQETLERYSNKIQNKRLNIPINYESVRSYILKSEASHKLSEGDLDLLVHAYIKRAEDKRLTTIKALDIYLAHKPTDMEPSVSRRAVL